MGLTFNLFILIPMVSIILLVYSIYKRVWTLTGIMIALMIFSIVFNPVKLSQPNVSVYEDTQSKFNDIPERVQVFDESFINHQNKNLNQLKKESQNEQP